ncbi:MAG: AAA family ATPase [Candidatus Heimdallarchaeota archaeon]|nr:MAG: AAA family ATPase [Candidatus Heimdallarchaeota archaeon]
MKDDKKNNQIKLTVAEALQMDVDRGIARIPDDIMNKFKINAGDVIEIQGKRKAVATVWRGRPEDDRQNIIRIDGIIRFTAGISIGEDANISIVKWDEAKSVTLSPLQDVMYNNDPTSYFHNKLIDRPLIKNQKIAIDVMGTQLYYMITAVSPSNKIVKITPGTKINVSSKKVKDTPSRMPEVTYEDLGGLKKETEMIREMVETPMRHPEVFRRLGIGSPKGVLLSGPPGTGKTLLAKAVASESESNFYSIAGPEILNKYYGETEKQLRNIFEEAEKNAPSVIFIDEIDSIAPKRGDIKGELEKRLVSQLLALMDGLKNRGQVVVMAATNRPEDLDPALRRPGRFDREIKINPPDRNGRKEILQIHTRGMPLSEDVDLEKLSEKTLGYTGADIEILCKEAAMKSLAPHMSELKTLEDKVPTYLLEKMNVTMNNFIDAFKMVEPSAMREVLIQKPNVKWSDIGGLPEVKKKIIEAVEWPLKDPDSFKKFGITPAKGMLLFGPSGTGKTLLAKAVANEADANFIAVKGPELVSKWVGESEKHIRDIFKKARQVSPSIIFFDEFDSIAKVRGSCLNDSTERMVNQLLTELDGVEELEKVAIIAATNKPELVDKALLRPGRIGLKIETPIPDEESRVEIFKVHTRTMPLDKTFDLKKWAKKNKGWTGADIAAMCREAGMQAMREHKLGKNKDAKVTDEHFNHAFNVVQDDLSIGQFNKEKPIIAEYNTEVS